jgi:hypothetical protein
MLIHIVHVSYFSKKELLRSFCGIHIEKTEPGSAVGNASPPTKNASVWSQQPAEQLAAQVAVWLAASYGDGLRGGLSSGLGGGLGGGLLLLSVE